MPSLFLSEVRKRLFYLKLKTLTLGSTEYALYIHLTRGTQI